MGMMVMMMGMMVIRIRMDGDECDDDEYDDDDDDNDNNGGGDDDDDDDDFISRLMNLHILIYIYSYYSLT